MTIRSFSNQFEVVDQTATLLKVPQAWTLLGDNGLFAEESITTQVATFQEVNGSLSIIADAIRGTKPQTTGGDVRKLHSYSLSHHPFLDALYPSDIAGKSAYGGDLSQEDTEAEALLRKMVKARKSFAITREIARFRTLGTGTAWNPNGTLGNQNFYTDLGYTRNEVDFALGTPTTDVIAKCEEIIADFQSKANDGEVITSVTGYASSAFFRALIAHAKVTQAHIYQQIGQVNITQERAGAGLYRRLSFGGINFVEVPTVLAGTALVTAGDCVFVAEGTESCVTFYGPANRFGHVGTLGQSEYLWTFASPSLTEITIEGETNMLNILKKPQFVSRGFTA